ncbi:purine-cytosine permease family protein [Halotalea alkalilenta]|uniref:Allantoin permease n=1 Tax=Halotalea alkalilenta TaxID=376489 RepID=A0A172YD59_9GAMM|nr:hypothetical protein [Halotalea alkalilenta]ANF57189.1 allantoin permease [Halotalea alkalilenta]
MAGKISVPADRTNAPDHPRLPRTKLMMAWWAVCSAIFYIVVAAAMARAYGTVNALIGVVLSVLCYTLVNRVLCRYAITSGLDVARFSQRLFGALGAPLATLIFFATALYYAVFEGHVMALALTAWSDGALPMPVSAVLVTLLGIVLIGGGIQRWLDKFNGVLLPIYVIGMVAAVAVAFMVHGYPQGWLTREPEGGASNWGWLNTFAFYMGVWVLMMFTFDYARFGREEDADFHAKVTFGLPFYLMTFLFSAIIGILLDATLPNEGISEASLVTGLLELMGGWGLLLVWVTQSRINTANFYLAASNLDHLIGGAQRRWTKPVSIVLVGILAYLLMLSDVFAYLLQALAYQGVFVVAWVGVAIAWLISPSRGMPTPSVTPRLERSGLIAWLGATAIGIALMYAGPLAVLSAPLTFVSALLLHTAATLFFPRRLAI